MHCIDFHFHFGQGFLWAGCLTCHRTNIVNTLKKAQCSDYNQANKSFHVNRLLRKKDATPIIHPEPSVMPILIRNTHRYMHLCINYAYIKTTISNLTAF